MSGWSTPPAPGPTGPLVGWETPSEPAGLGIRQSIGAGWRIFRTQVGTLVATAAVPEIVRNLLVIPSIVIVYRAWEAMIDLFATMDWENYIDDEVAFQVALQQRLEDAMRPATDLAIVTGVASGASIAVGLIGFAIVSAATLAVVDGRRASVGAAYGAVTAHAGALIVPALIVGLAWILVGTPLTLSQGTFATGDPTALRTQTAVSALLGLGGLVLSIAVVVLAVRWSLAFPAILAEDLSFRRGLSRSAELTSGIRVRIFAIFLLLAIVLGLLLGAIAFVAALIIGVATLSLAAGVAAYLVATTIGGFVWLPWTAAVLSYIYRVRAGPPQVGVTTAPEPSPAPDEPGETPETAPEERTATPEETAAEERTATPDEPTTVVETPPSA